jgi:hypothetical protein
VNRRRFVATGAGLGSLAVAGCLGLLGGDDQPATTATEDDEKPDGVYVQSFRETMSMQGRARTGDYRFALMFAVPHTFWTVTGDELNEITEEDADSMHLMAQVWDPETRTALPETGLSVEITRDGDLVSQETIYPMLSQPMSFHYGGNFELDEDGTYQVEVSVAGTSVRRTGSFQGRFGDPASATIPLEFTEESRSEVRSEPLDQAGQPGALGAMETMRTPGAVAPSESALPGTVRGTATVDDARFVVTTLSDPPAGVDGERYLAVSARTRYNDYLLPAAALEATLVRDGETVYEGPLARTLDPDLNYHYGAAVDAVQSGDELTLSVPTPPQVGRHEGYETAFLQFEDTSITL